MPYGYDGFYILLGCPGGGKTTRVAKTVHRICAAAPPEASADGRSPVVVVSLTNAAAREAAGRDLPIRKDAVGTLHSKGYRSLGCPPIVTQALVQEEWNREHPGFALSPETFSKAPDDDEDDPVFRGGGQMPGDDTYAEHELDRHRMTPDEHRAPLVRRFAALWTAFKGGCGAIDFTDMIEHGGPDGTHPGVVIADEAQDLSRLEFAYLVRLKEADGAALILVGDPDQCIYHWRGADWKILHDPAATATDSLPASHRLPRAVHAFAWSVIRRAPGHGTTPYAPRDADGIVRRIGATLRLPDDAVALAEDRWSDGKSVMLLAAANYMADSLAYELRRRGLPFGNPWRTRRGAWNPLAERAGVTKKDRLLAMTHWHDHDGAPWTLAQVRAFVDPLSSRLAGLPKGAKKRLDDLCADSATARSQSSLDDLRDLVGETVLFAIGSCTDGKAAARWWYEHLLDAQKPGAKYAVDVYLARGRDVLASPVLKGAKIITPGTIHSVKGGEADVVILFPDIPWAAERERHEDPEAEAALCRLFYVGATRAREELVLCEPGGGRGNGYFDWGNA
ncbi:MAG: UvrD-helicase domain-containing protein [Planctomycetota bacterium]